MPNRRGRSRTVRSSSWGRSISIPSVVSSIGSMASRAWSAHQEEIRGAALAAAADIGRIAWQGARSVMGTSTRPSWSRRSSSATSEPATPRSRGTRRSYGRGRARYQSGNGRMYHQ